MKIVEPMAPNHVAGRADGYDDQEMELGRRLVRAGAVALCAAVGACGQSATASITLSAIERNTSRTGPYRFSGSSHLPGGAPSSIEGTVDPRTHRSDFSLTWAGAPSRMVITPATIYSSGVVVVGPDKWFRSPNKVPPDPSPWAGLIEGGDPPMLTALAAAFAQHKITLRRVGTAVVRGVSVVHYVAEAPESIMKSGTQPTSSVKDPIRRFDVYVDDKGRLRRLHTPDPGGWTLDIYDFGTAPPVTLPPADRVTDTPETQPSTETTTAFAPHRVGRSVTGEFNTGQFLYRASFTFDRLSSSASPMGCYALAPAGKTNAWFAVSVTNLSPGYAPSPYLAFWTNLDASGTAIAPNADEQLSPSGHYPLALYRKIEVSPNSPPHSCSYVDTISVTDGASPVTGVILPGAIRNYEAVVGDVPDPPPAGLALKVLATEGRLFTVPFLQP